MDVCWYIRTPSFFLARKVYKLLPWKQVLRIEESCGLMVVKGTWLGASVPRASCMPKIAEKTLQQCF